MKRLASALDLIHDAAVALQKAWSPHTPVSWPCNRSGNTVQSARLAGLTTAA